jgi:hypothetical protein
MAQIKELDTNKTQKLKLSLNGKPKFGQTQEIKSRKKIILDKKSLN